MAVNSALVVAQTMSADTGVSYLNYVQNKGQWDARVLYRTNFRGGNLFLEKTAFTYVFYPADGVNKHDFHSREKVHPAFLNFHAVRMELDGALEDHPVVAENIQPYYHNYFMGNDPEKWISNASLCKAVVHKNMYNGIDVKVFSRGNNVRYDFIVSPGADPSAIALKFTGQDSLFLRKGQLVLSTSVGEISQENPYAYQLKDGRKQTVACSYSLTGNKVAIAITGKYDRSLPLIVDPTLVFSTFTGSTSDNWGMSAGFDQLGNAYTAGICFGSGYPTTTGAFQVNFAGPGPGPGGSNPGFDISISKFDSTGTSLLFSTYLGGSSFDSPQSITVDDNNCLIVLGRTYSTNFPVVSGCYNTTQNGGSDIIVTKFNSTGTALLASTFIGGSGDDGINYSDIETVLGSLKVNYADDARGAVHVDDLNNIYVASCTSSSDFPVTPNCFQPYKAGLQDGCVFKFNSTLSSLIFSSFIGGNANDAAYNLALDSQDRLYITGGTESANFPTTAGALHTAYAGNIDGFITHLSFSGNAITESSYIGTPSYDQSYFVQTDNQDNVYLFGQCSGDYPITPNTYSNANSGQFLHKLNPSLSTTIFSTEFGSGKGTLDIAPSAFLVDKCQNICVSGWGGPLFGYNNSLSSTYGMPVTGNATGWVQTVTDGSDFYFATFSRDAATLSYGTFFGGSTSLEHVDGGTSCFDKTGMIYQAICAGCGANSDMPTYPSTVWSTTNNSSNCNNGLVKIRMDLISTYAQANVTSFVKTGCAPFTANFLNFSIHAVSYLWDFGDGTTSTATAPVNTYSTPGTYTAMLVATNLSTCNQRDTTYLTINVLPPAAVVPQLSATKTCKGDSVTLSINFPYPSSYTWQPSGSLNNPNSADPVTWPSSTTVYTLSLNDSLCRVVSTRTVLVNVEQNITAIVSSQINTCNQDTLILSTDSTCASYLWSTGQTSPSIRGLFSGLFIVNTVDKQGCKGIDSIMVYRPVPIPSSEMRVCKDQGIQLNAVAGNYTYQWTPANSLSSATISNPIADPPATTIYTLTLLNGTCSSACSYSVIIKPKPDSKISSGRFDFCTTDSIQLSTKPSYGSYLWNTGATRPFIKILTSGVYSVLVTDTDGCKSSDTMVVTIYPPLVVASSSAAICAGQSVQLFAPTGTYIYRWYPASYLSGTLIYNPIATPPVTSIYTLVISNGPCVTAANHTIVVNPVPQLSLNLKTATLLPGESIKLIASSDLVCNWYPPYELSCTECNSPVASPEESVIYYCYVMNALGCSNTSSVSVEVVPTFYIPNTFTPNGDGLNEVFRPEFSGYVELHMLIFDRWGELLYECGTLNAGWDGSYKGKPAEQGTYVYKISGRDYNRKNLEKEGSVLLLR